MRNFLPAVSLFLLSGVVMGVDPPALKFGDIIKLGDFHYGLVTEILHNNDVKYFHKTTVKSKTNAKEKLCRESIVSASGEWLKDNYQDALTTVNEDDIHKRLEECKMYPDTQKGTNCCGEYDFETNNCEHTVTYIRYGMAGRVSCLYWELLDPMKSAPPQCKNWKPWQ